MTYASPNKAQIQNITTLDSLFSDDFGGIAVDQTNNWDVIDGGLAAIVSGTKVTQLGSAPTPAFSQGAIGSGVTGITDSVSGSSLSVNMGTIANAERWYLSKKVFAGKEDILAIVSKSQYLTPNSIFIGIVEVDPTTYIPLLNPNFANEFTNRGGCEFGLTGSSTAFQAEGIGDSSSAKAISAVGVAGNSLSVTQEYLIEVDSRDIIVSNAAVDSVAPKLAGACRVSSQVPNDKKLYKLLFRFKNGSSAPVSNTVFVIQRIIVIDNYELRVQVSTGEGDQIGSKAIAVTPLTTTGPAIGINTNGGVGTLAVSPLMNTNTGASNNHKLTSAATTNATLAISGTHTVSGGYIRNRAATERYVKFYNKASAPTVGTDVPIFTLGIAAGDKVPMGDVLGGFGFRFALGVAYAITGAYADSDTTAVAAGDVDINLIFI